MSSGDDDAVVEVVEVGEWREIMGKDIMVSTIKPGEGEMAEINTVVKCTLVGFLAGARNGPPFEPKNTQRFKIGEGDAIPGLELPLRHARCGEILKVKITSRFGFGPNGRPEVKLSDGVTALPVPPDADLEYDVEVLSHVAEGDVDSSIFDNNEELLKRIHNKEVPASEVENIRRLMALSDITLRKECGNRWFSYLDYGRAARCYSKGTKVADDYFTAVEQALPEEQKTATDAEGSARAPISAKDAPMLDAYVSCLNNMAACHLSQGEFLKAKDMCVKVLEMNPNNIKALLRAAKACLGLSDYVECRVCLDRVVALEPENESAIKERARLRQAERAYKAKSKEISKHIAKGLFPDEKGKNKKSAEDGTVAAHPSEASENPEAGAEKTAQDADREEIPCVVAAASEQSAATPLPPAPPKHANASPETYANATLVMLGTSLLVVIVSVVMAWYLHTHP